jgi:hypothetical protein
MHAICRTATGLVLLLSLLAPAMVCAIPDSHMTAAEHACCKQMKGKCGTMRMPGSHSCCQTTVESNGSAVVEPHSTSFQIHVAVLSIGSWITAPTSPVSVRRAIDKLDESPPPGYQPLLSVLRI